MGGCAAPRRRARQGALRPHSCGWVAAAKVDELCCLPRRGTTVGRGLSLPGGSGRARPQSVLRWCRPFSAYRLVPAPTRLTLLPTSPTSAVFLGLSSLPFLFPTLPSSPSSPFPNYPVFAPLLLQFPLLSVFLSSASFPLPSSSALSPFFFRPRMSPSAAAAAAAAVSLARRYAATATAADAVAGATRSAASGSAAVAAYAAAAGVLSSAAGVVGGGGAAATAADDDKGGIVAGLVAQASLLADRAAVVQAWVDGGGVAQLSDAGANLHGSAPAPAPAPPPPPPLTSSPPPPPPPGGPGPPDGPPSTMAATFAAADARPPAVPSSPVAAAADAGACLSTLPPPPGAVPTWQAAAAAPPPPLWSVAPRCPPGGWVGAPPPPAGVVWAAPGGVSLPQQMMTPSGMGWAPGGALPQLYPPVYPPAAADEDPPTPYTGARKAPPSTTCAVHAGGRWGQDPLSARPAARRCGCGTRDGVRGADAAKRLPLAERPGGGHYRAAGGRGPECALHLPGDGRRRHHHHHHNHHRGSSGSGQWAEFLPCGSAISGPRASAPPRATCGQHSGRGTSSCRATVASTGRHPACGRRGRGVNPVAVHWADGRMG